MQPFDSLAHAIVVVASVEAVVMDWSDRVPISTELMLTSQLKEEVTLAVTVMAELVAAEANSGTATSSMVKKPNQTITKIKQATSGPIIETGSMVFFISKRK